MSGKIEDMVREFMVSFETSLDPRFWIKLVEEELKELEEAIEQGDKENILKEACDLFYVQIGFNFTAAGAEQLSLFPDEEHARLMAIIKKATSTYESALDALGVVNMYEAFRRVHLSNMSKVGDDGLPIRDKETGKVLKGPNYSPPNLSDLIQQKGKT